MKTPTEELESPYLDGELELVAPVKELSSNLTQAIGKSPLANLAPDGYTVGDPLDEPSAAEVLETPFEQEVIGADERTLVADALTVPNRWVCAIDLLIADPKLGKGVPLIMPDARGTGILIGPRHVLTAKHLLATVTVRVENQDRTVPIAGVRVSPARHSDNTSHPLGKASSKALYRSKPYLIKQRKTVPAPDGGSRVVNLPIMWDDDYALIILDQELSGRTHKKMQGPLGYWGQTPSQTAIRQLDPATVQGREITVIGYPGDRCGKDVITGSSAADKERLINRCVRNRRDEWASTQWRSRGKVNVDPTTSRIEHTADTYKGESGAPICLRNGDVLDLLGVHTDSGNGQPVTFNIGVRVTLHMLREICSWMNADAGYQIASIKDDTLIVQPGSKEAKETEAGTLKDPEFGTDGSGAKELFESLDDTPDEFSQEEEGSHEFEDEPDEEDLGGEADADLPSDEITELDVEDAEESGAEDDRFFEALAGPPNCQERLKTTRVAVVGGGLAGLMAARILKQHGIKSTVFEARSQLGGRVLSNEKFSNSRITEEGAELIGSFHTSWLELAWQYGLAVISRMDESLYERSLMDMRVTLDDPKPLSRDKNIKLNKRMTFEVLRPIARLASTIKHPSQPWLEPQKIKDYDNWSVAAALEKLYLVPRTDQLWKAIELRFVNTEVAPLDEMNFLGLLCKVKAAQSNRFKTDQPDDPKGPENVDAYLLRYWNELEIFRCADGCQKLAKELANEITSTSTATIKKSRAVTHIELSKKGLVLKHKQVIDERKEKLAGGSPRSEPFDYVILAIPPSVWKGVTITVVDEKGEKKDAKLDVKPGLVKMGDAVKYFSDVKERFWIKKKAAPLGGSLTLGQVWEGTDNQTRLVKRKGSPLRENQGIVLSVFAGPILPGPRVPTQAECKKELGRLYPDGYTVNFNKDLFTDWPNKPFIKTGYASPRIGEFLKIGEELSKPFHDILFFAGEHTQMDFFGYMEGALRSGERAAKNLIAHLCAEPGKPVVPYPNPPGARTASAVPIRERQAFEYKSEVLSEKHSSFHHPGEAGSPFLDRNLFAAEVEEEWEPRAAALVTESPFVSALEELESGFDWGQREEEEAPTELDGGDGQAASETWDYLEEDRVLQTDQAEDEFLVHENASHHEGETKLESPEGFVAAESPPEGFPEYSSDELSLDREQEWEHSELEESVVDPFPRGIVMPLEMVTVKNDTFGDCIKAASQPADVRALCGAVVDLTGDPDLPPYRGHNDTDMLYVGSLAKIYPLLAAFELRRRVTRQAKDMIKIGLSTTTAGWQNKVFAELKKGWQPRLDAAFRGRGLPSKFPKLAEIVELSPDGTARLREEFFGWIRAALHHNDEAAAGRYIRALSYPYINGVLAAAGFFDPAKKKGLWISGDYNGNDWLPDDAAGMPLTARWRLPGHAVSNFTGTALQVVRFLGLMAQGKLVDKDSSGKMIELLGRPFLWDTLTTPHRPFTSVDGKVGIGTWDSRRHDGAIVRVERGGDPARTISYVLAVLGSPKTNDISALRKLELAYHDCVVARHS